MTTERDRNGHGNQNLSETVNHRWSPTNAVGTYHCTDTSSLRLVWSGGGTPHRKVINPHQPGSTLGGVNKTENMTVLDDTPYKMGSLRRTSMFSVNRVCVSLLRNLTLLVLLQCLCISTVLCQNPVDTCTPDLDCHPPSQNLVDLTIPGRNLEVATTCGTPAGTTTVYRKSSATLDLTDFYCNATYPHPKELMSDHQNAQVLDFMFENPKLSTYWQSQNTIDVLGRTPTVEYIIFNLTEPFLIRFIRAIFISPHILSPTDNSDMRPIAMVIEKKFTPASSWEPLRYYAENCYFYFGTSVLWQKLDGTGPSYDAKTPVCEEVYYSGDATTFTGWGYGRQEVGRLYGSSQANGRIVRAESLPNAKLRWLIYAMI